MILENEDETIIHHTCHAGQMLVETVLPIIRRNLFNGIGRNLFNGFGANSDLLVVQLTLNYFFYPVHKY